VTCPAPKILTARPCGHYLEPGQRVCRAHEGTDPNGRCEGETGPKTERIRCHAWPLASLPFCRAHDPELKAERQAVKQSLAQELARLRQLVTPDVAVSADLTRCYS